MASFGKARWADAGSSSDEDNNSDVEETPEEVSEPTPQQQAQHREPREHVQRAPVEIPTRGPFVAFVGNLAYGVDEDMLGNFFVSLGCEVTKVNVHRDRETNKSKGFSHVEFADRDSLAKALGVTEELKGRTLKVDVADRDGPRGGAGRSRGGSGRGRGRDSREPRDARDSRDARDHREPRDSGDARRQSGYDKKPRENNRDFVQHDRRAPKPAPAATDAPVEAPKERPKLILQPRSVPLDAVGQPAVVKSSIFGEGKPREEIAGAAPAVTPAVAEVAVPEEPVKKSALIIESPRTEPAKERNDRKNKPKQARDAHREVRATNGKQEGKEKKGQGRRRNPDANAAAVATAAAVKANKKRDEKIVGEDDFVTTATKKTGVVKKETAAPKPAAPVATKSSNMYAGLSSDEDSDA